MFKKIANFRGKMDAFFGDADWGTRFNSARSILGALRGSPAPVPPLRLQVEVTNRCNINCVMCSRHKTELKLGDIPSALYDKVSELSKHAQETILFGYGEPIISPAFFELLPRIHSSRFGFFTNGLIMTPRLMDRIRGATKARLSSLVFSIDGGTCATYERIREKSSWDKVLANLAAMAEYRREKGLDFELRVAFVAMQDNVRELPALYERLDPIGVDKLHVNQLVVWDEEFRDQCLFYHQDACREAFAEAARVAEGKRMILDLPYDFGGAPAGIMPPCRMPWIYTMISFEGDVRACCFAPDVLTMGSLHNAEFGEIWHNEKYRKLRQALHGGKNYSCCLSCENRFRSVASPNDEATYVKLKPRQK